MKRSIGVIVLLIVVAIGAYWLGQTSVKVTETDIQVAQSNTDIPMECPIRVQAGEYKDDMNFGNQISVVDKPIFIQNPQVIKVDKQFIEKDFIAGLYTLESRDDKYDVRKIDVDGDGQDETVISADTAMTKAPHIAMVVKDGKIIFEAKGAHIWIEPYYTVPGFILQETLDWLKGEARNTLYIPQDGGFTPIWTQKKCWVEFE